MPICLRLIFEGIDVDNWYRQNFREMKETTVQAHESCRRCGWSSRYRTLFVRRCGPLINYQWEWHDSHNCGGLVIPARNWKTRISQSLRPQKLRHYRSCFQILVGSACSRFFFLWYYSCRVLGLYIYQRDQSRPISTALLGHKRYATQFGSLTQNSSFSFENSSEFLEHMKLCSR